LKNHKSDFLKFPKKTKKQNQFESKSQHLSDSSPSILSGNYPKNKPKKYSLKLTSFFGTNFIFQKNVN